MQQEQLVSVGLEESVLHYAKLAKQAGLDGVVCSVHEAKAIGVACGEEFLRVTPGIRPAASESHDQKRIATPQDAKIQGATHIVVGRAITRSENPQKSYDYINGEWSGRS